MDPVTFIIKDMDCAEEVGILRRKLLPLVGEEARLSFDILQRKLRVDITGLPLGTEDISKAVARTGMSAEPVDVALPTCTCCSGSCPAKGGIWARRKLELLCAASGVLWAGGLTWVVINQGSLLAAFQASSSAPPVVKALWILAAGVGIWHVLPKAANALRSLRPDMNLLMVLAVAGAMVIGEYSEGASIAFLFTLASQLEAWSVGRARKAIHALMKLAPDTALLLSPPSFIPQETAVGTVPVNSLILVRPGDRVPLDGVISSGTSTIDQSPLTGESLPVFKTKGDEVFAGTINIEGALEVTTSKPATESSVARIMRMVEEAQSRRARTTQWVDRFAAVYTPVMMGAALLVAIIPPLVMGAGWVQWFYEALVVLIISCPCALVISTPVTIVAGLASAARNGVLIKGGAYLEAPATLTAVALDKTGTLTHGKPKVTAVVVDEGASELELLRVASGLELGSSHPVGQAVVRYATALGISPASVKDFQVRIGMGVQGRIQNTTHYIGNLKFVNMCGQILWTSKLPEVRERQERVTGTLVLVWTEEKLLGSLLVEDDIRLEARAAMGELRGLGIDTIVMLTGDSPGAAAKIASESGVTQFQAGLLPEDKTRVVSEMADSGLRVAMVGDGINDAPALAASYLGVVMGSIGTDVAMETADVALMSDDLSKLPWLIRHSRRTQAIIKANIVFALGLKAIFLLLALAQAATLWMAIIADLGASILVIFNGMRMLRIDGKKARP